MFLNVVRHLTVIVLWCGACTAGRPPGGWQPELILPLRVVATYPDYPPALFQRQWGGLVKQMDYIGIMPIMVEQIVDDSLPDDILTNNAFWRLPIHPDKSVITVYLARNLRGQYDPVENPQKDTMLYGEAGIYHVAISADDHWDDNTLAHEVGHILLGNSASTPNYGHDPWYTIFKTNMAIAWVRDGWTPSQATTIRSTLTTRKGR